MDPAPQPQDPAQLISDLAERVPDVHHVLIVSADGVPLAASSQTPAQHLDKLAAITSSLISLADSTARILDYGAVAQAVVVMEEGTFIIMAIDAGASLAVLTTAADLDQVAYEMTMLVERSAATLTTPARTPATATDPDPAPDPAPLKTRVRADADPDPDPDPDTDPADNADPPDADPDNDTGPPDGP